MKTHQIDSENVWRFKMFRLELFIFLFFILMNIGMANIIYVPKDYSEISSAINVSYNGNAEIIVSPGTYSFFGLPDTVNNIYVHSLDPTSSTIVESTIIIGNPSTTQAAVSIGQDNSYRILAGFTITNAGGSGINGGGTSTTIENCHIINNMGYYTVTYYNDKGSRIPIDGPAMGGGIYQCNGLIQNNIIEGNEAGYGGGLYQCNGIIQNNIIANNAVTINPINGNQSSGAGLYQCNGIIRNNTIVDNIVDIYTNNGYILNGGGMASCTGSIYNNIVWVNQSNQTVEFNGCSQPRYCCIKDWTGGGQANFSDDPYFVNATFGIVTSSNYLQWPVQDYHLEPDSPCIDAGMTTTTSVTTDFYGLPRGNAWYMQGVHGDGSHTDIGAIGFNPGTLMLWIPNVSMTDPATSGQNVGMNWAMAAGAGTGFSLWLSLAGQTVYNYGTFPAPAGHTNFNTAGLLHLNLPFVTSTSGNYQLCASIHPSGQQVQSFPFTIQQATAVPAQHWLGYK